MSTRLQRLAEIWKHEGAGALVARALRRAANAVSRDGHGPAAVSPESEQALIHASADYWRHGDDAGVDLKDYSHWRGAGPWKDEQRWLLLGQPHVRLCERLQRITGSPAPRRVVEWGCGGGANAIHFAGHVDEYCGIEIAQPSLDECRRVLQQAGFDAFRGVLIEADAPESALDAAGGGYHLLLSTYVFELLPGKAYGARVLQTGSRLLAPGGLALIQIRYDDGSARSSQKHADYFRNSTRFTSYHVDEFWLLAEQAGLIPEFVWLAPRKTEEFSGDLYAYFGLRKPG